MSFDFDAAVRAPFRMQPGFDATPAIGALLDHASREHPQWQATAQAA